MTAPYSAGRGLVVVGVLLLVAAIGPSAVAWHLVAGVLPVVFAFAGVVAGLVAIVGWIYVGVVMAFGATGATGLAGPAWWARAACVGFGAGQLVSLLVEAVTSVTTGVQAAATVGTVLDVGIALLAVVVAVSIARAGTLTGFARWAFGLVAATQVATAVVELVRPSALPWLSTVLVAVVLPVTLVVVGTAYLHAARTAAGPDGGARFVTRAGRTSARLEMQAPLQELVAGLRSFVAGHRRFALMRLDVQGTAAVAEISARVNWAAWGARIVLRFEAASEGCTIVEARWSPALVTTVVTWDQGQRDLRAIADGMTRAGDSARARIPFR